MWRGKQKERTTAGKASGQRDDTAPPSIFFLSLLFSSLVLHCLAFWLLLSLRCPCPHLISTAGNGRVRPLYKHKRVCCFCGTMTCHQPRVHPWSQSQTAGIECLVLWWLVQFYTHWWVKVLVVSASDVTLPHCPQHAWWYLPGSQETKLCFNVLECYYELLGEEFIHLIYRIGRF